MEKLLEQKIAKLSEKKQFKTQFEEIVNLAQISILKELQIDLLRNSILKGVAV